MSAADLNGRESIVNFTPDPSRVKVTILERVAPFGFFPAFYLHSANNCSCVVELWHLQCEQAPIAWEGCWDTWSLSESTEAMCCLNSVPLRALSVAQSDVETSVERARDIPRGSQRTELCGGEPTVSHPQYVASAARWFDATPTPCGAQRSCL